MGSEILFRALVGLKYGLFVMDADGTNVRTLDRTDEPGRRGRGPQQRHVFGGRQPDLLPALVPGLDPALGDERGRLRSARVRPRAGSGLGRRRHSVARWPMGRLLARHPGRACDTATSSVVRADGTGPIIPTGPDADRALRNFHWSPDSTKILMIPSNGSSPIGIPARPSRWSVDDACRGVGRRYRLAAPRALIHAGARPRRSPDKKEPRVVGPGVQGVCGLVAGRGFEPLTFGL